MDTTNDIPAYFFPANATLGEESSASILAKWSKLKTLPEPDRNKLTSQKSAEIIQGISAAFNFNQKQASLVAIMVRGYYFGELKIEDMPVILSRNIRLDFSRAKEIVRLIIEKIINDKSQEIAYQARLDSFSIHDALKQYPEVGEQLITSNRISLRNFPEPVRPSIKNWLADYTFTVGFNNKDSIVRGNYVFHSNNTMHLSPSDRQKLTYILRAYDENMLVNVNRNIKQIIFPVMNIPPKTSPAPQLQKNVISQVQAAPQPRPSYLQPAMPKASPVPPRVASQPAQAAPQFANPIYPQPAKPAPFPSQPQRPAPEKPPEASPIQSTAVHQDVFTQSTQPRQTIIHPDKQNEQEMPTAARISFSSPQKLPYEKTSEEQKPEENKPRSFVIRPVFSQTIKKEEPAPLPKNVVNLKDNS